MRIGSGLQSEFIGCATRPGLAPAAAWSVLALLCATAAAAPSEPAEHPAYRPLRPDHVRTWEIFADTNANGILDPGDASVERFDNWWTPMSSHTQHNYSQGPYGPDGFTYEPGEDMSSGPMNFAHKTVDGAENYWLPREKNAMHFYMTHSQLDNHNWEEDALGLSGDMKEVAVNRHKDRQGWALGWVTNDIGQNPDGTHPNDQSPGGTVEMDIFVHKGAGEYDVDGWGASSSNPQVSMSNDISPLALDDTDGDGTATQFHPPQYDETAQGYSLAENETWLRANDLDEADLREIIASMEISERNPYGEEVAAGAVDPDRTPEAILAGGLTDHEGNPYLYEDAFFDRSVYAEDSSDGGVIAGLSGYTEYDDTLNNWGDQQVVRIDFGGRTLVAGDPSAYGNINQIVFYDFGYGNGSGQTLPRPIVLDVSNPDVFPERRVFLAPVVVPEPVTLAVLTAGAIGLFARRPYRPRFWTAS